MKKYNGEILINHTLKWTWQEVEGYTNEHLGEDVPSVKKWDDVKNDKMFVSKLSNGLTK